MAAADRKHGLALCTDRDREKTMSSRLDDLNVADGDLVLAKDMPDALTAATPRGVRVKIGESGTDSY